MRFDKKLRNEPFRNIFNRIGKIFNLTFCKIFCDNCWLVCECEDF